LPELLASVPLWFWIKFPFVVGLSGYQGFLFAEGRHLAQGQRRHSERFWRLMSEVPFLVAIVAILLATLEPR
jgi:putative membrane protein